MLVDSHCHLNYPGLTADTDGVVTRARNVGVGRMLTICTTMREFSDVRAVAAKYDDVYCSVGVHPHHAHEDTEIVKASTLVAACDGDKVVGIGETGLDFFYDHSPRLAQEERFREHIRASITTGLPLIVHSRDAEADTMRVLNDERKGQGDKLTGVLHCFSSKHILAEEALAIGFYISLSGILTFKKSQELRDTARIIPLDRLLLETDSPYLAPLPYRGKPCEPAYVIETAKVLAELKGVSLEEISRITTENFFRLFKKVPRP